MALQKEITVGGLPLKDAYHRIYEIYISRDINNIPTLNFAVRTDVDATARADAKVTGAESIIPRTLYGATDMTQQQYDDLMTLLYDILKLRPEFTGSIDV